MSQGLAGLLPPQHLVLTSDLLCSPLTFCAQVPRSRLRGAWSHQRQVCLPQKCIGLPPGCPEAEGVFAQWLLLLEVPEE